MSERRTGPRYPVVLPALCRGRDLIEFHAVTVDISSVGIRMKSIVVPAVDRQLTCKIRDVGELEAVVVWMGPCDFAVRLVGQNPTPGSVARRLIELSQQQARIPETVRVARRIISDRTDVQVVLDDGISVPAQIINLSASGVALQISTPLALGCSILVGRRKATVTRQLDYGVGAAFLTPFDPSFVDEQIVL